MELELWEMLTILLVGGLLTLIGGVSVGMLVYKTKYAGEGIFKKDPDYGGAEVFNLDKEFTGSDDPADYKPVEYPPEIEKSVGQFEKMFSVERMVKAAEANVQEEEDAA